MLRHRLLLSSLPLAIVTVACATSPDIGQQVSDGGSTSASGAGGVGGDFGGGGEGGESPCGMDCSSITAPDCHVGECNMGQHPGQVGACVVVPVADATPCDDGAFCTVDDTCQAGVCTGGPQNDCGMDPAACQDIICDENADSCSTTAGPDGSTCTPADLCVVNGTCSAGQCLGQAKDCTFAPVPNECHVAACNPVNGECEAEPGNEGAACTDANDLCSVGNTCMNGSCGGGTAKDCSALNIGCQLGVCDAATGQCVGQAVPNGGACDDNDPCTSGETCNAGMCNGGTSQLMCMGGDLCCPAGCDSTTDGDCALNILLMGDDVSQVGWDTYRQALMSAGESWVEHDLDTLSFPAPATLSMYNTIIWFDESSLVQTEAQIQTVVDWLQGSASNRNLFITSVDFMWDMQNGSTGELNLYNAIGSNYVGDFSGTGITVMNGVTNDPISGSFAVSGLTLAGASDSSGDYASATMGLATQAGIYGAGGTGSGQSGLSHYNAGAYKLVWLGVNFHNGLTNPSQRNQLMQNIVSYFIN